MLKCFYRNFSTLFNSFSCLSYDLI